MVNGLPPGRHCPTCASNRVFRRKFKAYQARLWSYTYRCTGCGLTEAWTDQDPAHAALWARWEREATAPEAPRVS